MPQYNNREHFRMVKRLFPGELQALKRRYRIKTMLLDKVLVLNEGMRWVVLDEMDHPRLWYAFFATEEDAIRQWLISHDAKLEV